MENEPKRRASRVSRRQIVKGAAATSGGILASSYVKPSLRALGISRALAVSPGPPPGIAGVGTIGYWFAAPVSSWPVDTITIGGVTYSEAEANAIASMNGPDMTYQLFKQLLAAMLNVLSGADASCISDTIDDANAFLALYPPGSGVSGPHPEKNLAEDLKDTLDDYNNGRLCAPSRDTFD